MALLYLAAGGVLGTLARYGLAVWMQPAEGTTVLPWGTLAANLLGSLLLGLVVRLGETVPLTPELRLALTVGFCGAFTTFSTLGYETLALAQQGAWGRAVAYSLGSVALGLTAVVAGFVLGGAALRAVG